MKRHRACARVTQEQSEYSFGSPVASVHTRDDDESDADDEGLARPDEDAEFERQMRRDNGEDSSSVDDSSSDDETDHDAVSRTAKNQSRRPPPPAKSGLFGGDVLVLQCV